jgi:uncharacterized protein YigE (DUF2233 family)
MKLNRIALCTVSNLSKMFFVHSRLFSSACFYKKKRTSTTVLQSQRFYSSLLQEDIFLEKFNHKMMTYSKVEDHTLLSRKRFTHKMRFYGFHSLSQGLSKYNRIVLLQINDSMYRISLDKITLLVCLKLHKFPTTKAPCIKLFFLKKTGKFATFCE